MKCKLFNFLFKKKPFKIISISENVIIYSYSKDFIECFELFDTINESNKKYNDFINKSSIYDNC